MNYKNLSIIFFFIFLTSCEQYSSNKIIINQEIPSKYKNSGFALIYKDIMKQSVVLFLSEVLSYSIKEEEKKIEPKKGHLVTFMSSPQSIHGVDVIKSDKTRYFFYGSYTSLHKINWLK